MSFKRLFILACFLFVSTICNVAAYELLTMHELVIPTLLTIIVGVMIYKFTMLKPQGG